MTYIVAQHMRVIGNWMSLGTGRPDILGMVVRSSLRLALLCKAVGLAGAWVLARLMATLIDDLDTTEPATFAAVGLTLCLPAFLPADISRICATTEVGLEYGPAILHADRHCGGFRLVPADTYI